MSKLSNKELNRYARQIQIPEIGAEGQEKLRNACVLVAGAGGLGSPASLYLASSGVGTIGIADFDKVDESNLHRQILYTDSDIGKSKVKIAAKKLKEVNPHIRVNCHDVRLSIDNAEEIFSDYDLVIDGTDNFTARYLVNDVCVLLNMPYVYGSVFRFEGQATVFHYKDGPCYRCIYPEPPKPGETPTCEESGVIGPVPGIIGTIQAVEAIKIITGAGSPLSGRFITVNALDMEFNEILVERDDECESCGEFPEIKDTEKGKTEKYEPEKQLKSEISVMEIQERIDNGSCPTILDVRSHLKVRLKPLDNAIHIPGPELPNRLDELNPEEEIVVVCQWGLQSGNVCRYLRRHDFKNVRNLRGGALAWYTLITPGSPRF